jgi:hypothetical protein
MAKCIAVLKVCKTARERQDYAFDLTHEFAKHWEKDHPYVSAARLRPDLNDATGLEYSSSGGQSGAELPIWPATGTVDDGSIVWTPQAFSFASLKHRIASVAWDTIAGITLSDQVETDLPGLQEARITVSGGTARKKYVCPGIVTTVNGLEFEIRLEITIDP